MTEKTYTYSQLSSESVQRMVSSLYGLDNDSNCKFYVLGLHDNYLIESKSEKFILRIYRNNWRSEEEVNFEIKFLTYLNEKTDLVAELVPTKENNLTFEINSPEGVRIAVLFRYADGFAPGSAITQNEAEILARTVATVHKLSDSYVANNTRQSLDISYLLDDSIKAIQSYLDNDGLSYLNELQHRLHSSIPKLEKQHGVYGVCAGDVNPTNFHIDKDNKITLFDFDQCGYGFRAFEIGKFFSSVRNHEKKQEIRNGFLKGYQSVRSLSPVELEAIPIYEIISVIWVMAIQVYNADRIGFKYLEKPYWDRRLDDLKKLVSAWPNNALQPTLNSGAAEL